MSIRIRKEEYSTLGDFIRTSFVRDQAVIMARFPKLNAGFLTDFTAKLEEVKTLESGLVLTEEQKAVTKALYAEAAALNQELNFLSTYITNAELNPSAVSALKRDLSNDNIEGAVYKIEGVKQFITEHLDVLVDEGMTAGFPAVLDGHEISLSARNVLQNSFMNDRKALTDANLAEYKSLYSFISTIAEAGKLLFSKKVRKDQYTISKLIGRMRHSK